MKKTKYIPYGFILGLIIGIIYGASTNNMAMGVSMGIVLGLIIGVAVGLLVDEQKKIEFNTYFRYHLVENITIDELIFLLKKLDMEV
jgi:Na+/H+-dicarboxylate symporter